MDMEQFPELPKPLAKSIAEKDHDLASTELSTFRTRMSEHRTGLSSARSHLANERTHLAQTRTSLSLMSFGITLNRFSIYLQENDRMPTNHQGALMLRDAEHLGMGMVILGILMMMWSLYRYRKVYRQIVEGNFKPADFSVALLTSLVIVLGAFSVIRMIVN